MYVIPNYPIGAVPTYLQSTRHISRYIFPDTIILCIYFWEQRKRLMNMGPTKVVHNPSPKRFHLRSTLSRGSALIFNHMTPKSIKNVALALLVSKYSCATGQLVVSRSYIYSVVHWVCDLLSGGVENSMYIYVHRSEENSYTYRQLSKQQIYVYRSRNNGCGSITCSRSRSSTTSSLIDTKQESQV